MVIGGNPPQTNNTEILNLHVNGGICSQPANFEGDRKFADGAVTAYANDMVLLCGGAFLLHKCLGYDFDEQTWSQMDFTLREERIEANGLAWENQNWMIIGGKSESGLATSTSDIFNNAENEFSKGPLWPLTFWGHCAVVINETAGFVAGGKNNEMFVRSSYVMTLETGYWNWIGALNYDRVGHVCGVLRHDSFSEIIAAGGMDQLSMEVYSFSTRTWSILNAKLPHELNRAAAITYGDSFAILGGQHIGTCPIKPSECHSSKYIYIFDKTEYILKIRSNTMETYRGNHQIVSIPKQEMCSRKCSDCPGKYNVQTREIILYSFVCTFVIIISPLIFVYLPSNNNH